MKLQDKHIKPGCYKTPKVVSHCPSVAAVLWKSRTAAISQLCQVTFSEQVRSSPGVNQQQIGDTKPYTQTLFLQAFEQVPGNLPHTGSELGRSQLSSYMWGISKIRPLPSNLISVKPWLCLSSIPVIKYRRTSNAWRTTSVLPVHQGNNLILSNSWIKALLKHLQLFFFNKFSSFWSVYLTNAKDDSKWISNISQEWK